MTEEKTEFYTYNGVTYDVTFGVSEVVRHGGPFDRGSADSWYRRPLNPHYYVDDSITSEKVEMSEMTDSQIQEYYAGHEYNEESGGHKDWG